MIPFSQGYRKRLYRDGSKSTEQRGDAGSFERGGGVMETRVFAFACQYCDPACLDRCNLVVALEQEARAILVKDYLLHLLST